MGQGSSDRICFVKASCWRFVPQTNAPHVHEVHHANRAYSWLQEPRRLSNNLQSVNLTRQKGERFGLRTHSGTPTITDLLSSPLSAGLRMLGQVRSRYKWKDGVLWWMLATTIGLFHQEARSPQITAVCELVWVFRLKFPRGM